uniref:alpha/beta hydrolase-fold protein n=1 Tax=Ningiella ruwaisensis TaxID=2364274 RepID=UPI00109F56C2|nr:alpha/beta hydrolase-fold protein [Ningiella ruwaisensis]
MSKCFGLYLSICFSLTLLESVNLVSAENLSNPSSISIKVSPAEAQNKQVLEQAGRLHIVFSRSDEEAPRFYSAWPTQNIEPLFAIDLKSLNEQLILTSNMLGGFPHKRLEDLPAGEWYVQAIYDTNTLDSGINSPGNYFSDIQKVSVKEGSEFTLQLTLNEQIPPDELPKDQPLLKFVKLKSETLSKFWNEDMYLRAGVILPRTYFDKPLARFPVFFDIGGYGSRYTRAQRLYENEDFQRYWQDENTLQMVIVFLDGEAPFGDPYQINSANNGPYGDATWQELLPYLESQFNLVDDMKGRFVSGCSTGGWVSLALQIFYPDLFNGAWSYSADGVDFRYFQLVNIYEDDNAFFNEHNQERPSFREKDGDVIFSIKREISMENTMGRTNSFVTSGGQWGGWNAVYSPRSEDGLPLAIWDPETGKINKTVAEAWKKYDLRLHTEKNWPSLGPKLAGKLHIWMGDMDNFYLNNAMYFFEDMLKAQSEPAYDAEFIFKRGVGHCDYDSLEMRKHTISQMMKRFEANN